MNSSFDIAAVNYDEVFTNSHIGRLQRDLVQEFLLQILPKQTSLEILEINCGTGEDAVWLAKQGYSVIATDISEQMIEVAKRKQSDELKSLKFKTLDINDLQNTIFQKKFDVIFSDFGGLNCLSPDELQTFFKATSEKLNPKGKIVAVIMPKHCLLETVYFVLKGSFKKALRRNTKTYVEADVDGVVVPTWYYNPKDIANLSKIGYEVIQKSPIGVFIPPSYLETFFKNKPLLLKIFQKLDQVFKRLSFLSKYSDHYIISLSKI
ncbi:class I SAM-dependent methyltransferase [Aquimarina sp. MMG016]|uniref:class I SAM-dependent DNA methyltransferase n=1 Tax=Aquimarina sp. MMG016 TaxID=2822690 RepID=UPI001B3A0FB2|nr:class I SAM-dependent methyltransferase [Aquimarina sp. MMG016]MBQ4821768.1 methyltransferase domain-containing protein [Aquimarina sp. MMG016]